MMENFELAPRHSKFSKALWNQVKSQPKDLVLNKATEESRKLYSLHKQVAGDYQRCRAFSRLKISKHGIVYGKIAPEHEIEDMIAHWFLSRFPMFTVLLESKRGTFIIDKDGLTISNRKLERLLPILEKKLPLNPILKDLMEFNETSWECLYDANYIKQRKNQKLFLKNIPKKYHSLESLALERSKFMKCRDLNEFL